MFDALDSNRFVEAAPDVRAVPSVEPSSITINSNAVTDCASTDSIASSSIARRLYVGMITRDFGSHRASTRLMWSVATDGEDSAAQVVDAFAGSCRDENWRHAHRVETFERGGALRAAQLVAFGCDRNHFDAAFGGHRRQFEFVLLRTAAAIDQNRDRGEIGAARGCIPRIIDAIFAASSWLIFA